RADLNPLHQGDFSDGTIDAQAVDNLAKVRRRLEPVVTRHGGYRRRQVAPLFCPLARGQVLELNGQCVELLGEPFVLVRREVCVGHSSSGGGFFGFLRLKFLMAASRAGLRIEPSVSRTNFSSSSTDAPAFTSPMARFATVFAA